jgi:hypothetical protein
MSRINNAVLPADTAYGQGYTNVMLDMRYGGQHGFAPELSEWVNNASYVRRNLICILIESPSGFQEMDEPDYWVGTLRSLVELHAETITGLNSTLTVEFSETPVGGGGQMQEDVTDVKEARSQIVFRWKEKYGMPINRFFSGWIRFLLLDPHSKVASINTIPGVKVPDMLPDRISATMLFIEPDPTHSQVVKAYLAANMMPKSSGDNIASKDKTQAGENASYDIEFTGIVISNLGVMRFAQSIMDTISITGASPFARNSFVDTIHADVLRQGKGYSNGIDQMVTDSVT